MGGDDAGERIAVQKESCEICESSNRLGYGATQLLAVEVKVRKGREGTDLRRDGARQTKMTSIQPHQPPSIHLHPFPLRHVVAWLIPHLPLPILPKPPPQHTLLATHGQPAPQHRLLILFQCGVRCDQRSAPRFWITRRLEHRHDRKPGHRLVLQYLTAGGAGRGGSDHAFILFRDETHHCGGSPADVAESGLLCVKRLVDGVEVTLVHSYVVEDQAGGRTGPYNKELREISSKTRFFPVANPFFLFFAQTSW